MPPVAQTVSILDSRHRNDLSRLLDLRRSHLAQADVANLTLLLHPLQRAQRLFQRRSRVNAVKLIKINPLQSEPPQAHLDALNQVARAAHVLALGRPLAGDAAFGGDHHPRRVGIKRLGDQPLGNLRAIGVGGVDQRDAQFDSSAQNVARLGRINRFTPRPLAHQAHGSVAKTMNGKVAADEEDAAGGSGRSL